MCFKLNRKPWGPATYHTELNPVHSQRNIGPLSFIHSSIFWEKYFWKVVGHRMITINQRYLKTAIEVNTFEYMPSISDKHSTLEVIWNWGTYDADIKSGRPIAAHMLLSLYSSSSIAWALQSRPSLFITPAYYRLPPVRIASAHLCSLPVRPGAWPMATTQGPPGNNYDQQARVASCLGYY